MDATGVLPLYKERTDLCIATICQHAVFALQEVGALNKKGVPLCGKQHHERKPAMCVCGV